LCSDYFGDGLALNTDPPDFSLSTT
jgi:hypothetical protein